MRKENIEFLESHREVIDEINNAETATRAKNIAHEIHRILQVEFYPGYAYDGGCGNCLFDMTRLLYRKFDEWKAANKPIGEIIVAANFPSHLPGIDPSQVIESNPQLVKPLKSQKKNHHRK